MCKCSISKLFFILSLFFFFLLLNIFFLLSGFSRIFSQCESRWKITQNQLLGFSFQECCKNFDLFRLYLDSSFTYLFRPLLISLARPSLSPVSLEWVTVRWWHCVSPGHDGSWVTFWWWIRFGGGWNFVMAGFCVCDGSCFVIWRRKVEGSG